MVTLARTTSGLLYQSDGSLSGWVNGGNWSSVAATRLVASPSVPIAVGAIANQIKGEPKWEVVGGTWFMSYDDRLSGGQSVPAIQQSNDRGVSWVDLGPLKFAAAIPGGGLAVTSHFLDPVSGNWHLHALSGVSVTAGGGLNGPFQQYIYASTTGILGPYTLINTVGPNPGSWCNMWSQSGSCFWDGTHYQLFAAGQRSGNVNVLGVWNATTITGTFVQATPSTPLFDVTVNGPIQTDVFSIENVSYAYNSILNTYFMAANSDVNNSGNPFSWGTMVQTSPTPTGFSASGWKTIQWVSPADGPTILDVMQFLHSGSNSSAAVGPNGEMAAITSYQKPGGPYSPAYSNLWPYMSVLEPATAVIRYTGAGDAVYRPFVRPLAHADITIELACELTGIKIDNNSGEFHVVYRSDGTSNNEYRAVLGTNTHWRLDKLVAGSSTALAAGSGTQVLGNKGATLGYIHRLKVQVIGNTHSAWLDGELQYTVTDSSSPIPSGADFALAGVGVNVDIVNLSCRTSDTVTVNGMQPNTSCWLRAACGIPIAPVVANSSGIGTISYQHFPLFSLDVAGTDYAVGADSRIWGGDTLQFSGLPSIAPTIPLNFKNI